MHFQSLQFSTQSLTRRLHGSWAAVPGRAGRESNSGCSPESWQGSPDELHRLCQGNRYPERLPRANRLVFPREIRKTCVGLGPERAGSPPAAGSRQSPSGPQEPGGDRLGMLGVRRSLREGRGVGFPKCSG